MAESAVAQRVVKADKAQVVVEADKTQAVKIGEAQGVVENRLGYGRHVALLVRVVPDGDDLIGKTTVGELIARGTRVLGP
jgi:hypothetical protein